MFGCIHVQSYRLAKASGSTNEIAESVLHACNNVITDWIARGKTAAERSDREEIWDLARAEAKLRVTEARAGRCDAL